MIYLWKENVLFLCSILTEMIGSAAPTELNDEK